MPNGRERLVHDQQPAGLGDRAGDRVDVERRDRARVDHLDRDAFAGQSLARLRASCCTISARATTVTSLALAHDGRLAERDLVVAPPAPAP